MKTIKYILWLWISTEYWPPKDWEYLVLWEYGIATMIYTEWYWYAGDADIWEIIYWKRIIWLPDCKFKRYLDSNN